jgi:hypothetical protein
VENGEPRAEQGLPALALMVVRCGPARGRKLLGAVDGRRRAGSTASQRARGQSATAASQEVWGGPRATDPPPYLERAAVPPPRR